MPSSVSTHCAVLVNSISVCVLLFITLESKMWNLVCMSFGLHENYYVDERMATSIHTLGKIQQDWGQFLG